MDEANLYWTIVVAVVSGVWIVTSFFRDRESQSLERTSALVSRLLEIDKLMIENPEIQKYLSLNATRGEEFFRSQMVLEDDLFYKSKTLAYRQLNSFDEILSIAAKTTGSWSFLRPPVLVEISDWETYINVKLCHPLYRSILEHEQHIFGAALRDFWARNKDAIKSSPVDPFIW